MKRPPIAPGIIIGIDPSQRHNALAVDDLATTAPMALGEFGFIEGVTSCDLLLETAKLAESYGCHVFALIECPTWSGRGTKEVRSAVLVWERALHRLFHRRTVKRIDPKVWQKQILGAGPGADTKALAIRYASKGLNLPVESDHQADAACICEYARLLVLGRVMETK